MRNMFRRPVLLLFLFSSALLACGDDTNAAQLRIAGASPDGLMFTSSSANFSRLILIEPVKKGKVTGVSVEIQDFVGPDSKPVATTWTLNSQKAATKAIDVVSPHAARLVIEAKLGLAGDYNSWISLIYDGVRAQTVPLKVTRTTAAPTVRVDGGSAVSYEGWSRIPSVRFAIQETSGVPVTLNCPSLTKIESKLSDRSLQAHYDGVEFYKEKPDGNPERCTQTLSLASFETAAVLMKVPGLTGPGESNATLSIGSEDGSLPDQQFTIFLKRSWLCALICIVAGVVVSWLLRKWAKSDRPKLIQERRVLQLVRDLEDLSGKLPDQPDQDVLDVLRGRLQRLQDELQLGFGDNSDALIKDVNDKLSLLPLWSSASKTLENAPIKDAAREDLRTKLSGISQFLSGMQIEDVAAQRTNLHAIRDAIDKAISESLSGKIAEVLKLASSHVQDLAAARQNEFEGQVIQVLKNADEAAKAQPSAQALAQQLLEEARKNYAKILANDLEEKLGSLRPPGQGSDAQWNTTVGRANASIRVAQGASDGTAATTAAQSAYGDYLLLLVKSAQADASRLSHQAATDTVKYAEQAKGLEKAQQDLRDALQRIKNSELAEAKQAYDSARKTIEDAAKAFPVATTMERGRPVTAPRALLLPSTSFISIPNLLGPFTQFERAQRAWTDLKALENKINRRDSLVAIVVGLIASVLGVYLLWVDSLTWGSTKDILAAFLWGLGLHQVAGNAVGSRMDLGTLTDQVTGVKPGGS